MVRTYLRQSQRQNWNDTAMQNAIEACRNMQMGLKKAASTYGVPRATLQRRIKGKVASSCYTLGRFQVFTVKQLRPSVFLL